MALDYLRRLNTIGDFPTFKLFSNLYFGMAYNGLNEPDSALAYLQKTDADYNIRPDANGYANALGEIARAYDLKGDSDLANVYYKKSLALCKEKGVRSLKLIVGNKYCYYLLRHNNYTEAKNIARENIVFADEVNNFTGIAAAAEILQKVYSHNGDRDSAYQYALLQIAYKDSASNQKRITEFQNLTFSQKLKDIDETSRLKQEEELRHQNIQFALIAFGIITFIIIFLLFSRSIVANEKWISFFGILGLLIVFEFINLLIHPWLASFTHESPVLMLLALVLIASLLIPLHHRLEKWIKEKMVEKNKAIRLAAAKKTLEKLGTDKNQNHYE